MANAEQVVVKERAYTLTPEERNLLGNQLLGLLNDEDELGREKKQYLAEHKGKEEVLSVKIVKLREKASTGIEMRKYKCNRIRNAQNHTIDFVVAEGEKIGEILETQPWGQDDWDAHLQDSQLPLFDGVGNPDAPDEDDIRRQADLSAPDELKPDMENGQVIGGPNTDAYNMAHPESPYQALSEPGGLDFAPALSQDAAEPTDAADVDKADDVMWKNTGASAADLKADAADTLGDNSPDDSDDGNDEASDDDEPQPDPTPTPNPPKRKARRRDDDKK